MRGVAWLALLVAPVAFGAEVPGDPAPTPAGDPVQRFASEQAADTPLYLSQPRVPGTMPGRGTAYRLADGSLAFDLGVTGRYVGRFGASTDDQDVYQYVSVNMQPFVLGSGVPGSPTVTGAFLVRVAADVTGGQHTPRSFDTADPFRDLLDAERGRRTLAPRVATGYLEASDLLPGTRVRVGRQFVAHTGAFQLDGGQVTARLGDHVEAYAYGGSPVSYFLDGGGLLAGAGAVVRPWVRTRLELEYTRADAEGARNDLVAVAAEQKLAHGIQLWARFRELGADPWDVTIRLTAPVPVLGAIARVRLRQVLSDVGDRVAYPIAPFTSVLGPERRLTNVAFELRRPVAVGVDVTTGVQAQLIAGTTDRASQDYQRYFMQLDLEDLPWRGAFVTPIVEEWVTTDDSTTQAGLRWTQALTPRLELWLGSEYAHYLYDYLRRRERDDVRMYYAGTLWRPGKGFEIGVDLEAEQNGAPSGEDPFLTVMLWVTHALP